MAKYTYQVQMKNPRDGDSFLWKGEEWLTLFGFRDVSLQYAEGWCEGRKDGVLPCPGLRIIRVSRESATFVKVMKEYRENDQLSAGMMPAGIGFQWPYILRAVERGLAHVKSDARADRDIDPAVAKDIDMVHDMVQAIRRRIRSVPATE